MREQFTDSVTGETFERDLCHDCQCEIFEHTESWNVDPIWQDSVRCLICHERYHQDLQAEEDLLTEETARRVRDSRDAWKRLR